MLVSNLMKSLKIIGLLAVALLTACTKEYKTLNVNPNGVSQTVPERLLNPAVYAVVSHGPTRAHAITNDLMQVWVSLSETDEVHRYVIRPSVSTAMWNAWYLQRTNFLDMYRIADAMPTKAKAYMAIANIMDAHVTSLITDTYGDVPYFDANKAYTEKILTPKFDKQVDIYRDLFRKLEEANTLLSATITLSETQKGLDALYGGDMAKWRKFGNSLYLRLLLRVSAKADAIAAGLSPADKMMQIVANPTTYPIFVSNADNAALKFTGETQPLRSPFASWRDLDFSAFGSFAEFFINNLDEWGDPRLDLWATKYDNEYVGVPSGFAVGQRPAVRSIYKSDLKLSSKFGAIITYGEVQFILAELAIKGLATGSAATFYNNAVRASIDFWTPEPLTDVAFNNYIANPDLAWNSSDSFTQMMEKIHIQKYYALFFNDFQQWFEYRRTGHPILTKGLGVENDGIMPTRLYYPVIVQSLNKTNYNKAISEQGPDNLQTKVWWQPSTN